ncbi:MAG: flagellar hook-basal body complex protein FliE [Planctomycetota bacterium]
MVDRIGSDGGGLARNAILSALKRHARAAEEIRSAAAGLRGWAGIDDTASQMLSGASPDGAAARSRAILAPSLSPRAPAGGDEGRSGFAAKAVEGLRAVEAEIRSAERLPVDLLTGKIDDFHEVAVQIKRAELTFNFAMEVRNKLIDAYREVMRMNV